MSTYQRSVEPQFRVKPFIKDFAGRALSDNSRTEKDSRRYGKGGGEANIAKQMLITRCSSTYFTPLFMIHLQRLGGKERGQQEF